MSTTTFTNAILITGANRGMGLGYVRHYLKAGNKVIATARNPENAKELLALEKQHSNKLLIMELDVSSEESIAAFVEPLHEFKVNIHIAIMNAGISEEESYGNWTFAGFEKHFGVNTMGPLVLSQAIEPFMVRGSKLIQISSGMGSAEWNINPESALDAYAASKCALNILTRRLAVKLRPKGIIVTVINPGWVKTDMGGEEAPMSVEQVIKNMTRTIDCLTHKRSGCFVCDKGDVIPW